MQMARATYNGMRKALKNKRPFTILRSTYSGGQRYGSAWTGDNIGTWDHLRLACLQCQRMSMSGFSFVGSDIGGFTGNADAELFTRWIQMGAFTPLFRAHSSGDTIEREPWSYGPEIEAIIKKYIELRYKLLPYIYSAFWENHKYGFPIMRPVVMLEQELAYNTYRQDEFTLGDKILVCPVLEKGAQKRTVYLAKGSWYNYWTMERMEGLQEHIIDCPLEIMPLFVRAGSVIPEYPVMQYTGEKEIEALLLSIYYADYNANSFLYEDHGDTFAYEQEIYTEKKFAYEYSTDSGKVIVSQSQVGLFTPRYDTYRIRFTGVPKLPSKITLNNQRTIGYTHTTIGNAFELHFSVTKSFQTLELHF
jgi:alpha-glucosidase